MTPIVETLGVTFSYRRRQILSGASCAFPLGVTTLLGPNGAGKTTLLECLIGLRSPSGGTIKHQGKSVESDNDWATFRQAVGYVPQAVALPRWSRVSDAVGYSAWLSGASRGNIDDLTKAALRELQLDDIGRQRLRSLSGGQRQRVAIAAGIVNNPDILVLDEPTVGLDPGQRLKVRGLVQRLALQRAVVVSTHLTEDARYLGGRLAVLHRGMIRFQGSLDAFEARLDLGNSADGRGSAFELAYDGFMASLEDQ